MFRYNVNEMSQHFPCQLWQHWNENVAASWQVLYKPCQLNCAPEDFISDNKISKTFGACYAQQGCPRIRELQQQHMVWDQILSWTLSFSNSKWSKFSFSSFKVFLQPCPQILLKFELGMRTKMRGRLHSLVQSYCIWTNQERSEDRNARLCFFFKIWEIKAKPYFN